jgi:hypothetical protein
MIGKCTQAACGVKDGLSCEQGHARLTECPYFEQSDQQEVVTDSALVNEDHAGQRLPWTGRALGLSDLILASARSATDLVGLVGPFNAGKTAFLTSLFVHFAQTGAVANFGFAGSLTLNAWFRLKHYTNWPANQGPTFPPHTPDSADRVPSLLHLAFREQSLPVRDLLFTDAPGEWFTRWIQNQSSENARGARWIAENASRFLFFVDRDALAGPLVGKVRQDTLSLARVLSEHRRGQPVITIWAKSDLKTAPDVEAPIRDKLQKFFGDHASFDLHVEDSACLKVLEILLKTPAPLPYSASAFPNESGSAFFAYRGAFQ